MLKNDADCLPISTSARRIAVIGPLANASAEMRGVWWGAAAPTGHVTVLEGLRAAFPQADIRHSEGVEIESSDMSGLAGGVETCALADAIILCLGEAAVMSGEASSRAHLGLPGIQRRLAEAVFERAQSSGIPVIVVLFCGRPLVVPWLVDRANAVLAAWFLGSEAGNAIADVLIGRMSPSGRTPVTWPRAVGQVPIFYSERPSGRPFDRNDKFTSKYLDVANEPLFPFGFGLTYGRFELSNLRLSSSAIDINDAITIQVDVLNRGAREAQETVFLFTRDKVASVSRPKLELKDFGKITLKSGKIGTVSLSLRGRDLRFLGLQLEPVFEPGEVEILVGPCADRTRLLVASIQLVASLSDSKQSG
jgi:beta-glucosidase